MRALRLTHVSSDWPAAVVCVSGVVGCGEVGGKVERVATVTRAGSRGSSITPNSSFLTVSSPSSALTANVTWGRENLYICC